MPLQNLYLDTDSLRVGNNQLYLQSNAVYVGNNLWVGNTIVLGNNGLTGTWGTLTDQPFGAQNKLVLTANSPTPQPYSGAIDMRVGTNQGRVGITFDSYDNPYSDFAYIYYYSNMNGGYVAPGGSENGVLVIGSQNDNAGSALNEDVIAIEAPGNMYLNPGMGVSQLAGASSWSSTNGNLYVGNNSIRYLVLHEGLTAATSLKTNLTINGTTSGAQIALGNSVSNWISWNSVGVAAPTATTRSAGTKLVLYPNVSTTSVDYGLGVESQAMWFSVPSVGNTFKWYANTTTMMTLSTAASGLTVSANAWVSGNFGVGNTTSTYKMMVEGGAPWFKPNIDGTLADALHLGRFSDTDSPAYTFQTSDAVGDNLIVRSNRYNGYFYWKRNSGSGEVYVASLEGVNGTRTDFKLSHTETDNTVKVQLSTGTDSFINAAANVGIGTATPGAKLDVVGTANISANVWIGGSATIAGNLTVSGTTTYINTTNLNIGDNIITLNADVGAVAPSENAGIEVNRGTSPNVAIRWDESIGRWTATNDGTTYANIAVGAAGATLVANTTDAATYYLPMSNATSGSWTNAVAYSYATFTPSTGTMKFADSTGGTLMYTEISNNQVKITAPTNQTYARLTSQTVDVVSTSAQTTYSIGTAYGIRAQDASVGGVMFPLTAALLPGSLNIGNTTSNVSMNTSSIAISSDSPQISLGNSTVNVTSTSIQTAMWNGGTAYAFYRVGSAYFGNFSSYANADYSATGLTLRDSGGSYGTMNANTLSIGNTSVNVSINSTSIGFNGSVGTSGQVLSSNGTATVWTTPSGGGNGYGTIVVGGANLIATSTNDALTLVSGGGIALVGNTSTKTVTISQGTIGKQSLTGNGSNTVFTLAVDTVEDNTLVHIDGVYYHPGDDYSVTNTTITFSSAPISGAEIRIRFIGGSAGGTPSAAASVLDLSA